MDAEQKIKELEKKITELEKLLKEHSHLGVDKTSLLKTVNIPLGGEINIGNRILISGKTGQIPSVVKMIGGERLSVPMASKVVEGIISSIEITDTPDLMNAKASAGIGVATTITPATAIMPEVTATHLMFSIDRKPPGKVISEWAEDLVQMSFVNRKPKFLGNYFAAFTGPLTSGKGTIVTGGNVLTITGGNKIKSGLYQQYGYFVPLLTTIKDGGVEVHRVVSNTEETITIEDTFTTTGEVNFWVVYPIVLGATFLPWIGIRVAPGGDIRGMGSGIYGFLLRNPRNMPGRTLSGTPRTIQILIDNNPYYFNVYPTAT